MTQGGKELADFLYLLDKGNKSEEPKTKILKNLQRTTNNSCDSCLRTKKIIPITSIKKSER